MLLGLYLIAAAIAGLARVGLSIEDGEDELTLSLSLFAFFVIIIVCGLKLIINS